MCCTGRRDEAPFTDQASLARCQRARSLCLASDESHRAAGRAVAKMPLRRWTRATLCWKTVRSAISFTRTPLHPLAHLWIPGRLPSYQRHHLVHCWSRPELGDRCWSVAFTASEAASLPSPWPDEPNDTNCPQLRTWLPTQSGSPSLGSSCKPGAPA